MRTQQYSKVEAIVAKYKTLASNAEKVKATEKEMQANSGFYIPYDYMRLKFIEQLIARIYNLRAGESGNPEVRKAYLEAGSFYINGLLQDEEEKYLVEHFDEFIDNAFDHANSYISSLFLPFDQPHEWSSLVPYLLENKSGKIFIPYSDDGREFVGLNNCELTVGSGFENAAIRALACGLNICKYKCNESNDQLFSDLKDGQFNAVIAETHTLDDERKYIDNFLRITKEGGDLLLCISKEAILSEKSSSLCSLIIESKTLQEVILLPSSNILLHCVKTDHDSIVMCDASNLSQKSNERVIDVDAFQKEVQMANMPEHDDCSIIRRYSYDKVNENVLLPSYYLRFPMSGTPMNQVVNIGGDVVLTDECSPEDKVVTVNNLSNVFTKGAFNVDDLANPKLDRLRCYYKVAGPAIIMAVSEQNIAIGYTTDDRSFLVPRNLYVLQPKKNLDIRYLASIFFKNTIKDQLTMLVYGKGMAARLTSHWNEITLIEVHSPQEQQKLIQDAILKDYAAQENYVALQDEGFKHSIRFRKHALSQNISSFDSMFRTLEHCIKENKGVLKTDNKLSPVSPMTVAEAISILHSDLEVICERVTHLTDEQDWGTCESIEPQQFIENFEKQHKSLGFRFNHLWNDFGTNSFYKDFFDKKTGKLLFHEGESMNTAWFPKKALLQVFDNIVSNAQEHGFTDKNRQDYVIQTSWTTDGLNMLLKISNNGTPLPSDVNSDLVIEYGYTTALNQRGHGGIGGGEISEIMHKFGGNVKVISTPDKKFTVTYVLTMPLASLY